MPVKSRGLISFGVSFLLFAAAGLAQVTAIEGDVIGTDGQPLKGAKILIERTDMKGTYKGAKTDKKGHYVYNGLPLGVYTVSVLIDDKSAYHVDKVRTRLGDPLQVNMSLQSQGAQAAAGGAGGAAAAPEVDRGMSKEQKEALEKRAKENEEIMKKNKALNDSFNAGKEAMNTKDYAAAVAAFEKGSELDASQHVVWANLGDAYSGLASTKTGAEQQAALDKTLEAYQKAIALKPDDAGYHNNLALALARDKKFDEAQNELNKAAQIDPPNAGKYYYNLGALLVNSGQTTASEEAFKKAIAADPELRRRTVSVRHRAFRQAQHRRRRQDGGAARHEGSARKISGTGAHRPVRRRGQGAAAAAWRHRSN